MLEQFTLPYPPLQVRAGVLVVDGFGVSAEYSTASCESRTESAHTAARSCSTAPAADSNASCCSARVAPLP